MGPQRDDRHQYRKHQVNPQTEIPPTPRRGRRILPWLLASVVFAGGGLLLRNQSGNAPSGADQVSPEGITGPDYAAAQKTIAAFLAATTDAGRASLVIGGPAHLPAMEAYYRGREAEPLQASSFQPAPWQLADTIGPVAVLHAVRDRGLPPVVACVMQVDGRWLLDWEIWTQSASGKLGGFIDFPAEGLTTLRVAMTRQTPDGAPLALTLRDPFDSRELTLSVTDAGLAEQICRDLPERGTLPATVTVAWLNDSTTGGLEPRLRNLECWGFIGLSDPLRTLLRIRPGKGAPVAPPADEKALAAAWGATGQTAASTVQQAVDIATQLPGAGSAPDAKPDEAAAVKTAGAEVP